MGAAKGLDSSSSIINRWERGWGWSSPQLHKYPCGKKKIPVSRTSQNLYVESENNLSLCSIQATLKCVSPRPQGLIRGMTVGVTKHVGVCGLDGARAEAVTKFFIVMCGL